MQSSPTAPPRRAAFSTLASIVVAPNEAFASLRAQPAWAWALTATIVLAALGSLLATPAAKHMLEVSLPSQLAANPRIAGLPPDQAKEKIDQAIAIGKLTANFTWLFSAIYVPVAVLFEAAVLFALSRLARAEGGFRTCLALAAHVQFVALGIGSLVQGVVVALRPIESIRSQSDLLASVPSLALLAGGAPAKAVAFLAALGPFAIWATVLLGLGLVAAARLRPASAWIATIAITLLGAAWSAAFVR